MEWEREIKEEKVESLRRGKVRQQQVWREALSRTAKVKGNREKGLYSEDQGKHKNERKIDRWCGSRKNGESEMAGGEKHCNG